jgi:serine/threonine-protein kinase
MAEVPEALRAALSDRYTLLDELGRGGMATVYRAQDLRRDHCVALKILHAEVAAAVGRERFLREIEIVKRLNHPHILPLLDSGEAGAFLYYAMPCVEGESLQDRIAREGQLPLADVIAIARDVALGLAHAHEHGIVHRDVKPGNILLSGRSAVIADFGIARVLGQAADEGRLTTTGLTVGTPLYMAPEQSAGAKRLDGRADLYSLACVVYEMLAGAPPFTGSTTQAIQARHALDPPPPLHTVRPGVPPALERAVLQGLAKVPADRFATVLEFGNRLADGTTLAAETRARDVRLGPAWRRYTAFGVVAAAALAVALLVADLVRSPLRMGPKDWILLADFDGPADAPSLGPAMRELVSAELNQSDVLRTVPHEMVTAALRAAELPDTVQLDATIAREIAYRTSVRVIVAGGISHLGAEGYSIVLHVIDVDDGKPILSDAASAVDRGDEIVRTVQNLVRRTRVALGERRELVEANRPLMMVRTPSFAAFRKYAAGIEASRQGNWDGSNVLLAEAVALDTGFAAAWAVMAMNFVTSRQPDSAGWAFQHALRQRMRLSEAELYRLRADAAFNLEHDIEAAVRWYDAYLQLRPLSAAARNNRALYLSALGRHEEAAHEFAVATTVDPLLKGPRQIQMLNLAAELVVAGRLDSARVVSGKLVGAPARYAELLFFIAESRWDSAASVARRYATDPSSERFVRIPAVTLWAAATVATGRLRDGERMLRDALDGATGADARWFQHALLLLSDVSGRPVGPVPSSIMRDTTAGAVLLRGLVALRRGDRATAMAALRQLRARGSDRSLGFSVEYLEARIAAAEERWDQVLTIIVDAARAGEHDPFSVDRVGSFALRWLVAEAYSKLGKPDSATDMLEQVLAPVGMAPGHYSLRGLVYPFALRTLALRYAESARWVDARANWKSFLTAWSSPDEDAGVLRSDPTGGWLSATTVPSPRN